MYIILLFYEYKFDNYNSHYKTGSIYGCHDIHQYFHRFIINLIYPLRHMFYT